MCVAAVLVTHTKSKIHIGYTAALSSRADQTDAHARTRTHRRVHYKLISRSAVALITDVERVSGARMRRKSEGGGRRRKLKGLVQIQTDGNFF